MAQLVSHLPAGLRLVLQPVAHGFCLILQLPLLLENGEKKNKVSMKRSVKTDGKLNKERQNKPGDEILLLLPPLVSRCLLEDKEHRTSAHCSPRPAAAA